MINSKPKSISTRPSKARETLSYEGPTLKELIQLCIDFELINDIKQSGGRYKIRVREEYFDLNDREAGILARGLLLGSFALHTRDDMALAAWKR